MQWIYNIKTVAGYESKLLFRNWFLRVFTLLALIIIGFFGFFMVATKSQMEWSIAALPSNVPYVFLMMFNLIQAVLVVFMASDFARRDKSLDTSKVIYVRPVSNTQYYIGKTLGILYVFLILNTILLSEAMIMNLTSKLVSVDLLAYLYYPLLISFPTLIFLTGLSYLFMAITRNQAITFILLIAYVAFTSFYLGNKLNNMLDFMAYRVPLSKSDFIGFGNLNDLLIHRGMYVLYGIGFVFLSINFMNRLPNRAHNFIPLVIAILFISGGGFLSSKYMKNYYGELHEREAAIELNNQYINHRFIDITNYDISLEHKWRNIDVKCNIQYTNPGNKTIREVVLSLNQGMQVNKIQLNGKNIQFERKKHLIILPYSVQPGESGELNIEYEGHPDDKLCYLDADTSAIKDQMFIFMLNLGTSYGTVTNDYVVLTREMNFYPVAGPGYSSERRFRQIKDFAGYTIEIKTQKRLTAICQGEEMQDKKGRFKFKSYGPLPQISLIIGNYEKLSVDVDSVEFSLYHKKGHKYWTQHLKDMGDTISYVIRELKNDYERKLGITYPYKKFALVEVPVQFRAQPRLHTVAWEYVQPEMILLPENGTLLEYADFRSWYSRDNRLKPSKRISETDKQIAVFKRSVNYTLAASTTSININNRSGEINNYFSLFPLYYTHSFFISDNEYDIMDQAVEAYLNARVKGQIEGWASRRAGITNSERANLYLHKHSLNYYLKNELNRDLITQMIGLKGDYLFNMIKYQNRDQNFDQALKVFIESNRFSSMGFDEFLGELPNENEWNASEMINTWYNKNNLPGYTVDYIDHYLVKKDNKELYQLIFAITNYGSSDGCFLVTFDLDKNSRDRYRGLRGYGIDTELSLLKYLKIGETKKIGVLLEDKPNRYLINTLNSMNIPDVLACYLNRFELKENAIPYEGETLMDKPLLFYEENEVVCDNEDSCFSYIQPETVKPVARLFESKATNEFNYENFDRHVQSKWHLFTDANIYGEFVRSMFYTNPGKGDHKAIWKVILPEKGQYEIYAFLNDYFVNQSDRFGRGRDRKEGEYIYKVYHDDGVDDVHLDLGNIEFGWNYLGTFYFSNDSAKVELTNEGVARVIFLADAVKWVKN